MLVGLRRSLANVMFKEESWDKKPFASYTNHYQHTTNKCFIQIENTEVTNNTPATSIVVSDAFEGKTYGEFMWINSQRKKYWEVKPFMCKVTLPSGEEKYCYSREEFEELVKVFME